jgi:PAS domain S-box-containing protein
MDAPSRASPRGGWPAWLPIPVLLIATLFLKQVGAGGAHDEDLVRLGLGFVFSTLVSLFIACLVARTFLTRGTFGLLLFGCGVLLWGLGGLASSVASNAELGRGVAVHNICVFLSALCHLAGVGLSLRPRRAVRAAGRCLVAGYASAAGVVLIVYSATLSGKIPIFFVQGTGGTRIRYFVLGSAIAMFLLTAALLRLANRRHLSTLTHWYSLGLVLTGVGLFGIMMQTAVGNLINWAGRVTQYLGGVYMLIAAVAVARQTRQWGIPLEAALSEAKHQFEELFALAADGIVVHEAFSENALSNFTEANPAVCALLGYSLAQMRALGPQDITAPEDGPAVPVPSPPPDSSGVLRYERTLLAKDGRRIPAEIDTRFYSHRGRPMVMSVIRDITERRRSQEQIARLYGDAQREIERRKELELRLRRANKDLREFTSAIAHDLQSPLIGAISVAELISEEWTGRLGPDADLHMVQIRSGLERLHRMIRDLLDYSQAGHDDNREHTRIGLAGVIDHARLNLAARIQDSGAIVTYGALPEVEGNFARLVQLFQNLIENAIKYRGGAPPVVHVSAHRDGADWTICVSDNGIGIDPRHAEEVFGVFKRLNGNRYEGTGIGLSLCKRIVETMGGRIWVESKLGAGARFYFLIPTPAPRHQPEHSGNGDPRISDGAGARGEDRTKQFPACTILMVEDEDGLRLAAAKILRKSGFAVIEAGDGTAALNCIRAHKDRIDVLFLDVVLPGASSREVLEEAKRLIPGIRVIVTSSYSAEKAEASLADRVEHFVRKPYRAVDVVDLVRRTAPVDAISAAKIGG